MDELASVVLVAEERHRLECQLLATERLVALEATLERERYLRAELRAIANMTLDMATFDVHERAVRALGPDG